MGVVRLDRRDAQDDGRVPIDEFLADPNRDSDVGRGLVDVLGQVAQALDGIRLFTEIEPKRRSVEVVSKHRLDPNATGQGLREDRKV